MKWVKCLVVGLDNWQNPTSLKLRRTSKTLQQKLERNEKSCEAESGVTVVPPVVEPIPVEHNLAVILVEIRGVQVAVGVPHQVV